jgi:tRNA (guanine10-N2)-dimethyltransferase
VPKHTCCYGPGKITFGLSTIGFKLPPKALERTGLSVKKVVRDTGRPVRLVPTKGTELSSAQVLHNKMTDLPFGMELVLVRDGRTTWLCQTVAVQNIDAYAARDQARPKRDARVGMLPPKLAQIIVNLAKPADDTTVLDPFCGTGVLLQESLLMGYDTFGTDLEPRMVEYSQANLDWLKETFTVPTKNFHLEVGDATSHKWQRRFDAVACETYLGQPFSTQPDAAILRKNLSTVDLIHRKFLTNLAAQAKPGLTLCLAVPAWKQQQGFLHLPMLDQLESLGYTRMSFVHARTEELVYHREGQVVARELVVLIKK